MHDILQNLGIPNNEDTLSTVGGPCHFDYKSLNYKKPDACAICVTGMICIAARSIHISSRISVFKPCTLENWCNLIHCL